VAAVLLDGKKLAQEIQAELAGEAAALVASTGVTPKLVAVLVGDDPASEVYVRNKQQACRKVGMASDLIRLGRDTTTQALLDVVARLNADASVHGILVQLPVPKQIDAQQVLLAVSPLKDVDAFHPENVGRIVQGDPRFLPCTPYGVQQLLLRNGIETAGRHAVVLGRSDIVGKPMANLLIQRGAGGDATVTICHRQTRNLAEITRQADILIAAIGQPLFVKADMVKPGAAVVDVGTNRLASGKLVGDVDFEAVGEVAGYLSPVPGGVVPLTVTLLMKNTLQAARLAAGG
jgi:methylenetetrahydrofolate dehydrogenase (NADP+)/methenyltetrahydrofolate cyclohydrolase